MPGDYKVWRSLLKDKHYILMLSFFSAQMIMSFYCVSQIIVVPNLWHDTGTVRSEQTGLAVLFFRTH